MKPVLIFIALLLASPAFAQSPKAAFVDSINSAIAFGNMFGGTSNAGASRQISSTDYKIALRHIEKAYNSSQNMTVSQASAIFDAEFANQWLRYQDALKNRFIGWRDLDLASSERGVLGMERFRQYYQSRRKWIGRRLK